MGDGWGACRCRCSERIDALDRWASAMFAERDKQVAAALEASREAGDKSAGELQRRLDLLNEFRAQAADESAHYARKEVVQADVARMEEQVAANARLIASMHGRAWALAGVGGVLGALVGVFITVLTGA